MSGGMRSGAPTLLLMLMPRMQLSVVVMRSSRSLI